MSAGVFEAWFQDADTLESIKLGEVIADDIESATDYFRRRVDAVGVALTGATGLEVVRQGTKPTSMRRRHKYLKAFRMGRLSNKGRKRSTDAMDWVDPAVEVEEVGAK